MMKVICQQYLKNYLEYLKSDSPILYKKIKWTTKSKILVAASQLATNIQNCLYTCCIIIHLFLAVYDWP